MSEEVKQEETPAQTKPKQYLLVVDEISMAILGRIMPGLMFVQVEGIGMQNNPNHMLLVNPISVPTETNQAVEEPKV